MPRISLDVTAGTFTKIERICGQNYQKKADFLRGLIDEKMRKVDNV